jgi:hypothetical protein
MTRAPISVRFDIIIFSAMLSCLAMNANSRDQKPERSISTDDFTIYYPSSWRVGGVQEHQLWLLSSRGGLEGIGIKWGQGEIFVSAIKNIDVPIEKFIRHFNQDSIITKQEHVPNSLVNIVCSSLYHVSSEEEAIPQSDAAVTVGHIVYDQLFCARQNAFIVVNQRNWKDDPHQARFRAVAHYIFDSLTLMPPDSRPKPEQP